MGLFKCCIGGCNITSETHKLFCFPKNDFLRKKWLSILVPTNSILIGLSKDQLIKRMRVCEKHFDKNQFDCEGKRLRYAYPSLLTEKEIAEGVPLPADGTVYNAVSEHNYHANENNADDDVPNAALDIDRSPDITESPIHAIEPFDCNGDPRSVRSRWEEWKYDLESYFITTNTNNQTKKYAMLLNLGGVTLQDLYFNIPGAHVADVNASNVYDVAIKKLDEQFTPKSKYLVERNIFRLMRQEEDEKFENFLIRLRMQSSKCNFTNEDENLIDQIIEKCNSNKLKENIFSIGDTVTVERILTEANYLEALERQISEFPGRQNKNTTNLHIIETRTNKRFYKNHGNICARCSCKNYRRDRSVNNNNCLKCGFQGQFQNHCRTLAIKRKAGNLSPKDNHCRKSNAKVGSRYRK